MAKFCVSIKITLNTKGCFVMKKNKIISLVLAIVICLTATVLVVTANTKEASIQIVSDKTELKAGESATISVNVTTNFSVATMSIPVFYDKTMVTVSDETANLTDYSVKSTTTDAQSVNSDKVYADTNVDSSKYGFVLVTYIASAGTDVAETVDGAVLTFNITALADVEGDAIINCVAESAKTTDNVDGMLYFGSPASGKTINSVPENVENINFDSASETVVITKGSTEANTLMLKDGAPYEAVIDYDNCGDYMGTIYGIDTLGWDDTLEADGTLADFLTTAYGDDYLEVIVPDDAGVETTGTIINVLDEDGNAIESYVFVYFGDVDMSGDITSVDAFMCEYYETNYEGIDTFEQFMAGDLDADGWPTSVDGFTMEYYETNYEGMPEQADVAAGIVDAGLIYEMV